MNPDTNKDNLFSAHNVTGVFGERRALQGLNFDIHPAEAVTRGDADGAGKFTLVRSISGLFQATHGHYILNRNDVRFCIPNISVEIARILSDLQIKT